MELYERGGRYFGRVVSYEIPRQLDEENPDPVLRNRPFVGIDMIEDFRFDAAAARWVDGTIYDADDGRSYAGYLWFEGAGRSVLSARGYIGVSFLGRTERFERVALGGQ